MACMTHLPLPPLPDPAPRPTNRERPRTLPLPTPPQVDGPVEPTGELNVDETRYILRKCLRPEHRDDPNVIKFIAAYIRCRDHKQAAIESGLDPRSGYNLRMRPDVHQCIEELSLKSAMKYGFDASEVVERVKEISSADPMDFLNPDGSYRKMHEIPPEARRAIRKIKCVNKYETDPNGMRIVVGEIIEIELWDKMKAHELLGREKKLFKETKAVEHDIGGNMRTLLLGAENRAERAVAALTGEVTRTGNATEVVRTGNATEVVVEET